MQTGKASSCSVFILKRDYQLTSLQSPPFFVQQKEQYKHILKILIIFQGKKLFLGLKSNQNCLQNSSEQENHQWKRRVVYDMLWFALIQRHAEWSAEDENEQDSDKKQRLVRTEAALQHPTLSTIFKEIRSRTQTSFSLTGSYENPSLVVACSIITCEVCYPAPAGEVIEP